MTIGIATSVSSKTVSGIKGMELRLSGSTVDVVAPGDVPAIDPVGFSMGENEGGTEDTGLCPKTIENTRVAFTQE